MKVSMKAKNIKLEAVKSHKEIVSSQVSDRIKADETFKPRSVWLQNLSS